MRIVILDDADAVAEYAADRIQAVVTAGAEPVLGLATGTTPRKLYRSLIRRHRAGEISFAHTVTFNLDEYIGIAADNAQSYRSFMRRELFAHVDIAADRCHFPVCDSGADPAAAGEAYEESIRQHGGVDLQLLGIGRNGHIGFNEPTSSLGSRTRVKTLTESTIEANARLFGAGEFQPVLAMTMGIATILDARQIVLIATGEAKADAIARTVEGPLGAAVPATALQLHRDATVVVDPAAASGLDNADYYRWVYAQQQRFERR